MKVNSTLFDPIQVEGKCAVMTGEDTDVKAIQFRGSDETLAGSFHKNHVRIADDRTPEPRRGRQTHLLHHFCGSDSLSIGCNFKNSLVTRFLSALAELRMDSACA